MQLEMVVVAAVLHCDVVPVGELPGGHQDRPDEEHKPGGTSMT